MPRERSEKAKTRLTLEMSDSVKARLEALRQTTDSETYAEVIRKALAVYEFVVGERAAGRAVVSRGPDGEKELIVI